MNSSAEVLVKYSSKNLVYENIRVPRSNKGGRVGNGFLRRNITTCVFVDKNRKPYQLDQELNLSCCWASSFYAYSEVIGKELELISLTSEKKKWVALMTEPCETSFSMRYRLRKVYQHFEQRGISGSFGEI